jgi:hypothetical protein
MTALFRRFLVMSPLTMMAAGATLAPRVEILTMLVCNQLKPAYTDGRGMENLSIRPWDAVPAASPFQADFNTEDLKEAHQVGYVTWEMNGNGTTPPPYAELCKADAVVQAGVATMQAGKLCVEWLMRIVSH